MSDIRYVYAMAGLYAAAYFFYIAVSRGLGHKAAYLQLRRFLPCAILAVLPAALAQLPLHSPLFLTALTVGTAWIVTWPLLYFFTNRKVSSDFGYHIDIVFGLYVIGWLTAAKILVLYAAVSPGVLLTGITLAELLLLAVPLLQYVYFYLYGVCIDDQGMLLVQETNYNEIIEYLRSMPKGLTAGIFTVLAIIAALFFQADTGIWHTASSGQFLVFLPFFWQRALVAGIFLFLTGYFFRRNKGVIARTGIVELYLDVKEYLRTSQLYAKNREERLADLQVTPVTPRSDKPSTVILVIGESASRDYMSAFCNYPEDTTPWLNGHKDDEHFILFPHTYACAGQTVTSLERALTEYNQYNDKKFYTSCSIVDIARAAGYRTYWFSNQGHLGSADTPVTLVANTSDTAKWTKQNLNEVQYDEALLNYLKEVPAGQDNFIVLHLKGSHFNFINRYPASFTKWGEPGKYDLIPNYINSLAYTDFLLQAIQEYAAEHLHLQAMLYFSDHATIPDKRRSPNFGGFATVRIPMFVWFSDEYRKLHPDVTDTLRQHRERYFTTDLAYELLCGILAIRSNHYEEENSLVSPKFKYSREMLRTDLGRLSLAEDTSD